VLACSRGFDRLDYACSRIEAFPLAAALLKNVRGVHADCGFCFHADDGRVITLPMN
jgi:hypothetical protein